MNAEVKANNILVQCEGEGDTRHITQVQLVDLEDAAYVRPGANIRGKQVGNYMWRSPEAHAQGRVNKPTDIFSYGIVVSALVPTNNYD